MKGREVFYGTLVSKPERASGVVWLSLRNESGAIVVHASGKLSEIAERFLRKGDGIGVAFRRRKGGRATALEIVFRRE